MSDVRRKIGIYHSQFMKYLSAEAIPSRRNLRRMCDFFDYEEVDIMMSKEQFAQLLRTRPKRQLDGIEVPPLMFDLVSSARRQRSTLSKFLGYYHQYYLSFSVPRHILRALLAVHPAHEFIAYKRIERLKLAGNGRPPVFKYSGLATEVDDRIHMIDQETVNDNVINQTILIPTYRNRVTTLTGLTMGVAGNDIHEPSASRTVMPYLGSSIDTRAALAGCGLLHLDSEEVSPWIRGHSMAPGADANRGLIRANAL